MSRRFWKPSLTTQFRVCPIPFHLDSYRGCVHNCRYCFARDFTIFHRRKRPVEEQAFTYLDENDPIAFGRWLDRALKSPTDYERGEEVALKERIPLKLGATSDPFPPREVASGVSEGILKALHRVDYPVEIQTKNPAGIVAISPHFDRPNWTVAVTLISANPETVSLCEPGAPSVEARLGAMNQIAKAGIPVMAKVQPAIYPRILTELPALVEAIARCGCWAFNTEGLKVRVSMPAAEQKVWEPIDRLSPLGKFRDWYKANGIKTGSDYELRKRTKLEYVRLAADLAQKFGLVYFSSDNDCSEYGDSLECCGTEKLRDYRIWGGSIRSVGRAKTGRESKGLGLVKVNFCRSKRYTDKTLDDLSAEQGKRQGNFSL